MIASTGPNGIRKGIASFPFICLSRINAIHTIIYTITRIIAPIAKAVINDHATEITTARTENRINDLVGVRKRGCT